MILHLTNLIYNESDNIKTIVYVLSILFTLRCSTYNFNLAQKNAWNEIFFYTRDHLTFDTVMHTQ